MPDYRYATIDLRPAILAKLQKDTDKFYLGMLLPNALIIMMNDVKKATNISVEMHNINADSSGIYTSQTIRSV